MIIPSKHPNSRNIYLISLNHIITIVKWTQLKSLRSMNHIYRHTCHWIYKLSDHQIMMVDYWRHIIQNCPWPRVTKGQFLHRSNYETKFYPTKMFTDFTLRLNEIETSGYFWGKIWKFYEENAGRFYPKLYDFTK